MTREAERKRLVELICKQTCNYNTCENSIDCLHCKFVSLCDEEAEDLADALLDNGIVVPPCKVGDKVYVTDIPGYTGIVTECIVVSFDAIDENGVGLINYEPIEDIPDVVSVASDTDEFGKTIFLTKEEAEKALEGNGK